MVCSITSTGTSQFIPTIHSWSNQRASISPYNWRTSRQLLSRGRADRTCSWFHSSMALNIFGSGSSQGNGSWLIDASSSLSPISSFINVFKMVINHGIMEKKHSYAPLIITLYLAATVSCSSPFHNFSVLASQNQAFLFQIQQKNLSFHPRCRTCQLTRWGWLTIEILFHWATSIEVHEFILSNSKFPIKLKHLTTVM